MSQPTAVFNQSPNEKKRYVLDYTLDLDPSEAIQSVTATVIPGTGAPVSPAVVCTSVLVAPNGLQITYYISGGSDGFQYEVQFLAVTTLAKTLEDVVVYNVKAKV